MTDDPTPAPVTCELCGALVGNVSAHVLWHYPVVDELPIPATPGDVVLDPGSTTDAPAPSA